MPDLVYFLLVAPMVLLALTVHECAHAWTAHRFGDDTAADQGRISLNPLVHLDPWGALALLVAGFGWAKPVPYSRANLFAAHPHWARWTELAVSAAGPLSNLLLAGVLRVAMLGAAWLPPEAQPLALAMLAAGVVMNVGLFAFNLLPIHPLDGFRVFCNALPLDAALAFERTRAYGIYLLLGYLLLTRTSHFSPLSPVIDFLLQHVYHLYA